MDYQTFEAKAGRLPFKRLAKLRYTAQQLFALLKDTAHEPDREHIMTLIRWFAAPVTLWIIDKLGLAEYVVETRRKGEKLDPRYEFLLDQLKRLPSEEEQENVIKHEEDVESGAYDKLLLTPSKYQVMHKFVANNQRRIDQWEWIKKNFDLTPYTTQNNNITRTPRKERNHVSSRFYRKNNKGQEERWLFNAIFDCYCLEWNLYGMSGDYPLLQKMTVNRTPHGTILFIPKWLNPDFSRDINWPLCQEVHWNTELVYRADKRAAGTLEGNEMLKRILEAFAFVEDEELTGTDRYEFIATHAGLDPFTDEGTLRRHRRKAEKLRDEGKL